MNQPETTAIYDSSRLGVPAIEELRELWNFRNLLYQITRRNIVVRYKRSVLGIAWTMLNPLGTTLILTIVFSKMFNGGPHYAPYVLSGLICWTFFAQTSSDAMTNLIWGEGLIKRIYMPRTIFAVSAIGTGIINLVFSLVPLIFVMLVTGLVPKPILLLLPVPTLFLSMFSLGIGLILSTIAIYFADMAQMYGILLTAWMYLSPVIYTVDMLPQKYIWIIKLNPMYYIINLFRMPIYDQVVPTLSQLLIPAVISLVTLLIGWLFFASKADEFAYRI
jgi:homopolymeric O-antigen transport system permease protein